MSANVHHRAACLSIQSIVVVGVPVIFCIEGRSNRNRAQASGGGTDQRPCGMPSIVRSAADAAAASAIVCLTLCYGTPEVDENSRLAQKVDRTRGEVRLVWGPTPLPLDPRFHPHPFIGKHVLQLNKPVLMALAARACLDARRLRMRIRCQRRSSGASSFRSSGAIMGSCSAHQR